MGEQGRSKGFVAAVAGAAFVSSFLSPVAAAANSIPVIGWAIAALVGLATAGYGYLLAKGKGVKDVYSVGLLLAGAGIAVAGLRLLPVVGPMIPDVAVPAIGFGLLGIVLAYAKDLPVVGPVVSKIPFM